MSQIGITVGNQMYPLWIRNRPVFKWGSDPRFNRVPLIYDPTRPLSAEMVSTVLVIDLELVTDGPADHVCRALEAAYHGYAPPPGPQKRPEPPADRKSRDVPRAELVEMVCKLRDSLQEVVHDPNHTDWKELEGVMAWTRFDVAEEPEPEAVPQFDPAGLF